ncbi:salivary glue protein Sgs-5 isoform X2 [Drosophila eugracilis]|uniref:salivary glue protein Sgs-5 isoform X2 n=1 Tax=Drosophila eugracilis TaxID=29029 RepID=UPI0007E75C38|nr:salivary glue protein Sgs-5 isoform X2 [Drosophila eugracilis]
MDVFKLSLFVALFCGLPNLNIAQIRDCSGACNLQFRCDPYARNLVWTVSNGVCRVFQNSCQLGSLNCQRENQCLQPLVPITQDKCMIHCPSICPNGGPQVCAFFAYLDINGARRDRQMTLPNRCHLDHYACKNSDAHIGDPSIGPCP